MRISKERLFHYALVALIAILLYFSFLILKPFATSIIVSFVLTYLLYPLYARFVKRWGRPRLASATIVTLCIVLVVIPSIVILVPVLGQSINTFRGFLTGEVQETTWLQTTFGLLGFDQETLKTLVVEASQFLSNLLPTIISRIFDVFLGLFVMFFIMYYAFLDGERWVHFIKKRIPLEPKQKQRLFDEVRTVTRAVIYGQFLTSLIQGVLGGLMLFVFGVPNALVWGFIMVILAFIPYLGTPIVWLPIGVVEIVNANYVAGVGILVVGSVLVTNVDNILRPKFIGSKAKLSTPVVLLGLLGGLVVFGLTGLILGPLVLALLQTAIGLYSGETREA